AGNALDGEWVDASRVLSGDGAAGGDFTFTFNVAVGDIDRDGAAAITDVAPLRAADGTTTGAAGYSIFADLDANGVVDAADADVLRQQLGRALPGGAPNAPAGTAGATTITLTGADRVVVTPDGAATTGTIDIMLQTGDGAPIDLLEYSVRVELVGPEVGAGVSLIGGGVASAAPAATAPDPLNAPGNVDDLPAGYYLSTANTSGAAIRVDDGDGLIRVDYEISPGAIGTYQLDLLVERVNDTVLLDDAGRALAFSIIAPTLTVSIPGDLNGDFVVGANDLAIVLANFTQSVPVGDFSRGDVTGPGGVPDGIVGADDLVLILGAFTNQVIPPGGSASATGADDALALASDAPTAPPGATSSLDRWQGWNRPVFRDAERTDTVTRLFSPRSDDHLPDGG
ncbi:MAG: hypothetical protein CMJ18_27425, partial [Phycisphaeraceae bacterium]|nr:hypothetical protein [Phycisphaeraceae bacterium]